MGDEERFPLADMITALGAQVREAQRRAEQDEEPDLLKLKECTIELGVTWEKKAEGGLEFWVVKLGGGVTKQNVQTIAVSLQPVSLDDVVLNVR